MVTRTVETESGLITYEERKKTCPNCGVEMYLIESIYTCNFCGHKDYDGSQPEVEVEW